MALVDRDYAAVGTPLEADVRGRRVTVETEPLPFYTRKK
jgi:glycine cleavage system aminomethyltransferase T